MSSSRGNSARKRPQKHQNKTAFRNDLHDSSIKTKFLNSLDVAGTGVCIHCKDVIDWKIKYKKYKALTAPKKCAGCDGKTIKYAYHVFCTKCATVKNVCPKCCKPNNMETSAIEQKGEVVKMDDIETLIKKLPERKRRTIIRNIKKLPDDQIPSNIVNEVQDLLANLDTFHDSDEFSSGDDSD